MFFQLDNQQTAALNRFGLIFISLSAIAMGSSGVIPELFSQRRVFYLQHTAGYFHSIAFHATLFLIELLMSTFEMFLYSFILYIMSGLSNGVISEKFLYFWLSLVVFNMVCWSVSTIGVFGLPTQGMAQSCVQLLNAMMLLFSGYLIAWDQIPAEYHNMTQLDV